MKRLLAIVLMIGALAGAYALGRLQLDEARVERQLEGADAVTVAWSRVHAAPSDPNAWAELGEAQAAAGDLVGAEHAYLTAIRSGGDNGLAYARLGFLHYEKNEDDRALALLTQAKERRADVPMLDFTIDALKARHAHAEAIDDTEVKRVEDAGIEEAPHELTAEPSFDASVPPPDFEPEVEPEPEVAPVAPIAPAPPAPPRRPPPDGVCSIPVTRIERGRTFVVTVALYGHWASLIIDTGASITVVTRAFADAVRLPRDPNAVIRAITANGRVEFGTAIVPEVVLANRVAENVRIAVCDDCVESVADGLLGLDLVAAFGMRLDLVNETVHFADCE